MSSVESISMFRELKDEEQLEIIRGKIDAPQASWTDVLLPTDD